jgi:hypothetical protein
MTGAQTDRVQVPDYVVASAVILRVGMTFWQSWLDKHDENGLQLFDHWAHLRFIAQHLLERFEMVLLPGELRWLDAALSEAGSLGASFEDIEFLREAKFTVGVIG